MGKNEIRVVVAFSIGGTYGAYKGVYGGRWSTSGYQDPVKLRPLSHSEASFLLRIFLSFVDFSVRRVSDLLRFSVCDCFVYV